MGNRFREKTVEEGLDGDVAREALKEAMARGTAQGPKRGNKMRVHGGEEARSEKIKEIKSEGDRELKRPGGNRRRKHDEEALEMVVTDATETKEQEIKEEGLGEETEESRLEKESTESAETPANDGRGNRLAKGVAKVLGGDILADKLVLRQIPLLLLCLVFLLLVVANRYQVESLSRKKMAMQEKVNELREQQIQLQKKNQNSVRISQIRDDLKREKDLAILPTPPNVI
jgi:hypothetical protein